MKDAVSSVDGATPAEDLFVELFRDTFGLEKAQYLINEYPEETIYGDSIYIDYAVFTQNERYAFEIDGEQYHNPVFVSLDQYQNDLLKRNSLTHRGWKVFTWTYRQLVNNPEKVKSELYQFLNAHQHFIIHDDFLPRQRGTILTLRPHQEESLRALQDLRCQHHTLALICDAQGTGKTTVAVLDARSMNLTTLFIAHRREIMEQAEKAFRSLWPEATVGVLDGETDLETKQVVIASIQALHKRIESFSPGRFGYIIIDEAHHATAPTYREIIAYFQPQFLLGLTATPERHDQESIMEIFQNEAHRLDLKTAVEIGELVPIRCVRIKTNIDFTRVRINGINYNWKDLDQTVHVPERNRLIVDTYLEHVPGQRAVCFCAGVQHAEEVAALFRARGVVARSVDGRMKRSARQAVLDEYRQGKVQVLCACDILNEGWDSPETAVLLMARPTLSKVVYLQQLGRGTRKAPGKEALLVFDFIDNTSIHNHSVNLHRLLKVRQYRPGAMVLAPPSLMEEEKRRLALGEKIETTLPHNIFATDYEVVDLFDWREDIGDMMSLHELAIELYVDDDTVRHWVENGRISPGPDLDLPMGRVSHRYFRRERLDEIRQQLGIPARDPKNIRNDFFSYVRRKAMSASYKPVMLKCMLTLADAKGQVLLKQLTSEFRQFYEDRISRGLPPERSSNTMSRVQDMTDFEIARLILTMPFEKFERKFFVEHRKDLDKVAFTASLWKAMSEDDRRELIRVCEQQIEEYYRDGLGVRTH